MKLNTQHQKQSVAEQMLFEGASLALVLQYMRLESIPVEDGIIQSTTDTASGIRPTQR